ncbi:protein lev-9 isoform X1 [Patella vulgata]|uniref:protein lev-9 isoform X1 n=1 Tax=Patella vulgata TaxID=6465 RepID=UPI0021801E62|nr:protein lev-9 isoform X1 [Patella vulgata]
MIGIMYKKTAIVLALFCNLIYVIECNDQCGDRRDNVGERRCSKRCATNQDCVSAKKKCLCDGVCGLSCINTNMKCVDIEGSRIPHGHVEIIPFNQFGAVAKYRCDDGYTLFGITGRVCQGDETWSRQAPTCNLTRHVIEKQECGRPPQVNHAHHSGPRNVMSHPLGSTLLYECDAGFTARKDVVVRAWCVGDGVWVGPNLTCSHAGCDLLPDIPSGTVHIIPPNMIGGRARYSCYPGFHLVGRIERTCQSDGQWDGSPPSCEKVVCGRPPEVEHASHDAPTDQLQFQAGTQLTYTCVFGYYREGAPRSMCTGEGQWVGPRMTCKARNCGAPGEINNGWRDPGYKFTFPSRVTYHCNEGFELLGRAFRECQSNGEWSGILPTCEPIECQELGPPLHGTMIGSGRTYGSLIRFVCNDGYKVVGSAERRCQADRLWSGQEARCEEIDCGVPGPLWNGYVDGHRTTVGSVYFFRCYARTTFDGPAFAAQCLESGQWSQNLPKCLGQCQVPAILNGSVVAGQEGVWVDHGTAITYTCKEGLELNDTSEISCNNGTWKVIPRCVPAPCKTAPPQMENGHRVFFNMNHGDRARYFCMEGYRLRNDHRYLTCNFGIWEGPTPQCEENFCPNPGSIPNGQIYKKGHFGKFIFKEYIVTIKHGDRLEYECQRNYKLVGPSGAACVNGKWSPPNRPRCIPARHPILPKLWRPMEEQ